MFYMYKKRCIDKKENGLTYFRYKPYISWFSDKLLLVFVYITVIMSKKMMILQSELGYSTTGGPKPPLYILLLSCRQPQQ